MFRPAILLTLLLSACGQTGALVHPDHVSPPAPPAAAVPQSPTDTAAGSKTTPPPATKP